MKRVLWGLLTFVVLGIAVTAAVGALTSSNRWDDRETGNLVHEGLQYFQKQVLFADTVEVQKVLRYYASGTTTLTTPPDTETVSGLVSTDIILWSLADTAVDVKGTPGPGRIIWQCGKIGTVVKWAAFRATSL